MPALRSYTLRMAVALVGLVLLALLSGRAQAADPQSYKVRFISTGNGGLNALLRSSSQLDSLRKSAPVGPFALVDRAQQDIPRLQSALESFGYYQAHTVITIEGHPLSDSGLPALLTALPKKHTAQIEVRFQLGPLYRLGKVAVVGAVTPGAAGALKLESGDPAVARNVLDARDRLLTALEDQGHAYASVTDPPVALLQDAQRTLDVSFAADPGPIYTIGTIDFEGLKHVKESFLRRQLKLHTGERYSASKVEDEREALLNMGVFAAVSVRLPPRAQAQGSALTITFVVTERKPHAVSLSGEYSSDLGVVAGAGWTDRNLLGRADQLAINGNIYGLGGDGTATNGISYTASAALTLPDFGSPTQSLQIELQALKPELTAYTQIAVIGSVALARKLSSVWSVSAGLSLEDERILQQEVYDCSYADPTAIATYCYYTLLSLPLSVHYDSTDLGNPLLDPVHGWRGQLLVTPTETLHGPHAIFTVVQANASTYFDLSKLHWTAPGQSVLALRGLVGQAIGTGQFGLPADLRFYAGGSATVRGYAFQDLGPTFPGPAYGGPDATGQYPEGGSGISAGTIEFRQRVWGNFGLAAFLDGGTVTTQPRIPGSGQYEFGYGGGPRYYTPIGPIRLDVAFPLHHVQGQDSIEAYIGLGQAF